MKRPELLVPAGNLEKLRTAILYGADAVYLGLAGLSLRAEPAELSLEELAVGVSEAHQQGVKVYTALNAFARDRDLIKLRTVLPVLAEMAVDGVILSDPGVLRLVKQYAPVLPIHLSTQANTTNLEAVRFWADQGVKRFVLARELQMEEISAIAHAVPELEMELFIHGAMCMAYSGRCYLSAFRNRRSANLGDCTQPCRWEYRLQELTRPDQPLILEEDEQFSYLLSSKDLCLLEFLPEVIAAGVASLKIEGRMKSAYYVAAVTKTYRQALDAYFKDPAAYKVDPSLLEELKKVSNRDYTTGFYFSNERINEMNPEIKYIQTHVLAGTVLKYDETRRAILVGVRNKLTNRDEIELILPGETIKLDTSKMRDQNGAIVMEAHNGYRLYFPALNKIPVGAVLRRKVNLL